MSETQAVARDIPTRRVVLNDASQLPHDYSTTPGGTLFSTTPGGNISTPVINFSFDVTCVYCGTFLTGCHGYESSI